MKPSPCVYSFETLGYEYRGLTSFSPLRSMSRELVCTFNWHPGSGCTIRRTILPSNYVPVLEDNGELLYAERPHLTAWPNCLMLYSQNMKSNMYWTMLSENKAFFIYYELPFQMSTTSVWITFLRSFSVLIRGFVSFYTRNRSPWFVLLPFQRDDHKGGRTLPYKPSFASSLPRQWWRPLS